jgi:hypothetical protein
MYIPLKRKGIDICISGNKSYGKTLTMTALGVQFFLLGYKVFSNYHLEIPHIRIDDIDGFKLLSKYPQSMKKIVLLEDFEVWLHSRNASKDTNLEIGQIIINNGKNNASTIYAIKRAMAIDIGLRDTTDFFIECRLVLPLKVKTGNSEFNDFLFDLWSNDFSKLWVELSVFDSNLNSFPKMYLKNLPFWGSLYNTQEIVKELKN